MGLRALLVYLQGQGAHHLRRPGISLGGSVKTKLVHVGRGFLVTPRVQEPSSVHSWPPFLSPSSRLNITSTFLPLQWRLGHQKASNLLFQRSPVTSSMPDPSVAHQAVAHCDLSAMHDPEDPSLLDTLPSLAPTCLLPSPPNSGGCFPASIQTPSFFHLPSAAGFPGPPPRVSSFFTPSPPQLQPR